MPAVTGSQVRVLAQHMGARMAAESFATTRNGHAEALGRMPKWQTLELVSVLATGLPHRIKAVPDVPCGTHSMQRALATMLLSFACPGSTSCRCAQLKHVLRAQHGLQASPTHAAWPSSA